LLVIVFARSQQQTRLSKKEAASANLETQRFAWSRVYLHHIVLSNTVIALWLVPIVLWIVNQTPSPQVVAQQMLLLAR
jgi:hypothetical protein